MFDKRLNLYHQILENIADGVCLMTPDGTIRYWNRGAAAMTGLAPETVIGRTCHEPFPRFEDEGGNASATISLQRTAYAGHFKGICFFQ